MQLLRKLSENPNLTIKYKNVKCMTVDNDFSRFQVSIPKFCSKINITQIRVAYFQMWSLNCNKYITKQLTLVLKHLCAVHGLK